MIRSALAFFAATSMVGFTNISRADVFEYQVHRFGGERGINECVGEKNAFVAAFTQASGVEVIASECQQDLYEGNNGTLVMTYLADESVKIWDSENDTSTAFDRVDTYLSFPACEQSRSNETALMKSLTGLNVFHSKCYNTSGIGRAAYRHRILAVGTSSWKRFDSSVRMNSNFVYSQSFLQSIKALGESENMKVVAFTNAPSMSMSALSTVFYAEISDEVTRPGLNGLTSNRMSSLTECESAIARIQAFLPNDRSQLFCLNRQSNNTTHLAQFWWSKTYPERNKFEIKSLSSQFPDANTCNQSALTIENRLRQAGEPIVGAVCGFDSASSRGWTIQYIVHRATGM
jgi:hypothetical protein